MRVLRPVQGSKGSEAGVWMVQTCHEPLRRGQAGSTWSQRVACSLEAEMAETREALIMAVSARTGSSSSRAGRHPSTSTTISACSRAKHVSELSGFAKTSVSRAANLRAAALMMLQDAVIQSCSKRLLQRKSRILLQAWHGLASEFSESHSLVLTVSMVSTHHVPSANNMQRCWRSLSASADDPIRGPRRNCWAAALNNLG